MLVNVSKKEKALHSNSNVTIRKLGLYGNHDISHGYIELKINNNK